jgi:uncharacterized protein involved in exopolysaccharide biosynthesis
MSKEKYIEPYQPQNDEISLKELLLKIQEYWAEIRRNWRIVVLITLPFVGWFGYEAFRKPVTYTAQLTFMLNDDKGGGGMASILGQFGGLLGGGGSEYQLGKILEIARSRRITSTALFNKINIDGQEDYFANHVIRTQNLHERWKKDSTLNGFVFKHADFARFTRTENKALQSLHGEMIGGEDVSQPMLGTNLNDDTGILSLSIKSRSEMLSIELLNKLYEELSAFYISKSIQREQTTLDILAQKRDSIARALNKNDYSSASFDDRNRSLLLQTDRVPGKRYQRDNQLLTLMYGEAVKNTEVAEFALKSSAPFLTLIDVPIPPIKPDPRGRGKALVTGFLLGLILVAVFVIGRKVVREAMTEK